MTEQKKSRREILEQFVTDKPGDAFSLYALAIECMNTGDATAADRHFRALTDNHADYVPPYLMYAQFLVRESRNDEARDILTKGIGTARRKNDRHAVSELEALLQEIS
jgi:predicted Zn-dependent protease